MKRALGNHRAMIAIEIEYRSETEIESRGQYLGGQQPAGFPAQPSAVRPIAGHRLAKTLHRRQRGVVLPQALHPSALLIDGQQQFGTQRTHFGHERRKLCPRGDIAREKNHPADAGMAEQIALLPGQRQAFEIKHDRTERSRHAVVAGCNTAAAAIRFGVQRSFLHLSAGWAALAAPRAPLIQPALANPMAVC